jgi:hypothetical protein
MQTRFASRGSDLSEGLSVPGIVVLVLALALGWTSEARANPQCLADWYGVGLGPTLVIGSHSGGAGWEVSASCHGHYVTLGGEYQRGLKANGVRARHYLAYEPGLIAGAIVGASYDSFLGPGALVGAWTGAGGPVHDLIPKTKQVDGKPIPSIALSLSLGWHFHIGRERRHYFYVAPKVWYFVYPDFFT